MYELTSDGGPVELLKTQQNDVHRLILAAGFDPVEFEWKAEKNPPSMVPYVNSVLVHKPSGYFFKFITSSDGTVLMGALSPGEKQLVSSTAWGAWEFFIREVGTRRPSSPPRPGWVENWLGYLRREVDAPSPWEEAARRAASRPLLGSPSDNTPFTPVEVESIREELDSLRERVRAVEAQGTRISPDQWAKFEEGLTYVKEAAARLGRYDWRHVAATALITKASEIGVPLVGKLLIRVASQIMSGGVDVPSLTSGDLV